MDIGGKGVRSDINVTPLVDVVLVLLVIFMVVTPMLQRGVPVRLPRARLVSELEPGAEPILLSVTSDGRVFIDRKEVPRKDIGEALTREMARAPGSPVVLKGDGSLDYRTVREVILELSKARVTGVSLAATRIEPGEAR